VINAYASPETLGNDRLANAVAASALYPSRNVLILDAGTCIKYDFISAEKIYTGGAISPGLSMRFMAMHNYTARLPLLNPAMDELIQKAQLTGSDTYHAMLSGVVNGAVFEAEGFIAAYAENYPDMLVLVTGGDRLFFEKHLKSEIFAHSNLVLPGLHVILDHNLKNN
jgi:type III pantothenate kinase